MDTKEYLKNKNKEIWETKIVSTGPNGDLRKAFPILIATGSSYFGANSKGEIKVTLHENDKKVLKINEN